MKEEARIGYIKYGKIWRVFHLDHTHGPHYIVGWVRHNNQEDGCFVWNGHRHAIKSTKSFRTVKEAAEDLIRCDTNGFKTKENDHDN